MPAHEEIRVLNHAPDQMFNLVADVERYPEFLPWCLAARLRPRAMPDDFDCDMVIGFKMVRQRYSNRVTLNREQKRIDISEPDGPFRHLVNHWIFEPHGDGCRVNFWIDFQFRSTMLENLMSVMFSDAVGRMVLAFENRADDLYGNA